MRTLKRVGASALALGVAAAGIVMSAPLASAHTGTLDTSSVCQDDGTYKITYSGHTENVPEEGPGHVATFAVGEIVPPGTAIAGAPETVTGNTTYSFTQTVPGTATKAAATAFLEWGDGVKSDPIGEIALGGDCMPPAPECVENINNGQIDAHYVTDDFHAVVAYTGNKPLCDDASIVVSLNSYQTDGPTWPTSGTQVFVDHDQVTIDKDHTTGNLAVDKPTCFYQTDLYFGSTRFDGDDGPLPHYPDVNVPTNLIDARNGGSECAPTPTAPSGDLATDCVVGGGGHVAASNLVNGSAESVDWRLVSGTDASHTTVVGTLQDGTLEASGLADGTKVWLQFNIGEGFVDEGSVETVGHCAPPPVVAPTGSFTVVCTATGADVKIGTLSSGTAEDVVWTLTVGTTAQHVSTGDVVAVPALAVLALKFTAGEESKTVQTETAPAACPPTGEVDKTAVPATGSVVSPGQTVTYTVVVKNAGSVKIENKPAVDTLPEHVTLVAGSITGGGVASSDGRSITWSVTLEPAQTATFTYQVTVDANAPGRSSLLNRVVFLQDEATTTHQVGERSLAIVKSVSPTGEAEFGDTLTYSLVVTAGGNLGQTGVVVTDYIPGYKPGRASGTTTYVTDSATCDAGTCTASYDDAAKLITWQLGNMAPGTSRTVSFKVTIDTPATDANGGLPATTIFNSAAVASTEVPSTPSNEVETPVTAVLGVKEGPKPQPPTTEVQGGTLPRTGAVLPRSWTLGFAVMFLAMGTSLLLVARKPKAMRVTNGMTSKA